MKLIKPIILTAFVSLTGCTTGSELNKSTVHDARQRPSANIYDAANAEAAVQAEVKFGRKLAAKILGNYKLYDHPALNRYVNLVGQSVAQNSSRPELHFYFAVLDSDHINAYAAPGGYIFITRGALNAMQDESELAAVLAHEVAHVTEKHIVNELNIRAEFSDSTAMFSKLLSSVTDTSRLLLDKILDNAQALLFDKGLKKEDEFEADHTGIMILTNSAYDPMALKRYLTRIAKSEKNKLKIVLDTHPSFEARLEKLNNVIATNELDSIKARHEKSRFIKNVRLN